MDVVNALGRRKSSIARVYVSEGTGKITINKKDLTEYFPSSILQFVVKQPLQLLEAAEKYDIKANLTGGGFTGQSQALRLAIARALVKINPEDKAALRKVVSPAKPVRLPLCQLPPVTVYQKEIPYSRSSP